MNEPKQRGARRLTRRTLLTRSAGWGALGLGAAGIAALVRQLSANTSIPAAKSLGSASPVSGSERAGPPATTPPDAAPGQDLSPLGGRSASPAAATSFPRDREVPSILIAARNASEADQKIADIRCSIGTNDDATIQAAIDTIGPGAIYLSEGLFELTHHLTLGDNQTLQGSGPGSVLRVAAGSSTRAIWTAWRASRITIRSLTIDGMKSENSGRGSVELNENSLVEVSDCDVVNTGGRGIFFVNCSDFLCHENRIRGTGRTPGRFGESASIAVQNGVRGTIVRNSIDDANDFSIWITSIADRESADVSIESNRITNGAFIGIGVQTPTGPALIKSNAIDNCLDNGIDFGTSQSVQIENNFISRCGEGIVGDGGGNTAIERNVISSTTGTDAAAFGHGILVIANAGGFQRNINVTNNVILHAFGGGIYFDGIHDSSIKFNVVINCASSGASNSGIRLADFGGFGTINNIIQHNRAFDNRPRQLQSHGCVLLHDGTQLNVVEENDFSGNLIGGISSSPNNTVRNNVT